MKDHPDLPAWLALISVCFFWGTTYLGIRMALESFPPLVLVSSRFLLSGSLLLAAAWLLGMSMPSGREWFTSALLGVLILGVGNGCLTYSELWIPSSLAALFITPAPFWMVGLDAVMPGGERLRAPVLAGMLVGFCGTALLVVPNVLREGIHGNVGKGFLILQLGIVFWCSGSLLQRRHRTTAHPIVSGAVQQLAAGLVFLLPALLANENDIRWSNRGAGALLYLVLFGSIVGYSSYIYALDRLPVALVSLYNYVNPVVAAILGWLFYREPFGRREVLAMGVIFAGVTLVRRSTGRPSG